MEADRRRARREERGAGVDVELAGDDHLHDVERVLVGDAPAGDDTRRLPEPLLELGRLRAAAVHDDDALAARRISATSAAIAAM